MSSKENSFSSSSKIPLTSSLLLSPPGSLAFNSLEGSALLVPTDIPCDEGQGEELGDSFIGQIPTQETRTLTFQQHENVSHPAGPYVSAPYPPAVATMPLTNSNAAAIRAFHPYSASAAVRPLSSVTNPSQSSTYSGYPMGTGFHNQATLPQMSEVPIDSGGFQGTYSNLSNPTSPHTSSFPPNFPPQQIVYKPVQPHWFYCKKVEKKELWIPFSLLDSVHLEEEYAKSNQDGQNVVVVATDGGRYDVYLHDRVRCAIYWEEDTTAVRRATWFFRRDGEKSFIPYPEHFAEKLEEEYYVAVNSNTWHRRLEFPRGETVVIHNPNVIVHYQPSNTEKWEGTPEGLIKPSVVKRGMDDYEQVEDGEVMQIDHLVFVVHGIGAICDLKFRTLPEVVNDFRSISASLLKTHFRSHVEEGKIGRVEFIPASWHTFLHGEATGIDEKLKPITLKSIPKLRYFANDAILDVLFYTSPFYCQAIINQVGSEINRLYELFLSRNPTFQGKVSLAGHSLGSVILFDILLHQADAPKTTDCGNLPSRTSSISPPVFGSTDPTAGELSSPTSESDGDKLGDFKQRPTLEDALQRIGLNDYVECFQKEKMDMDTILMCSESDLKDMGIPLGPRKKMLAFLKEKQQEVAKEQREAADKLSEIPRIEPLTDVKPGRRRKQSETTINYIVGLAGTGHPYVIYPRLNFEPTCFFALGSPIAMFLTVRGLDTEWEGFQFPNCPAFFNIFHPFDPVAYRIEPLIDPSIDLKPVLIPHHKGRKRMHLEIKESLSRVGTDLKQKLFDSLRTTWNTVHDFARAHRASTAQVEAEMDKVVEEELRVQHEVVDDDLQSTISSHEFRDEEIVVGQLNGGRRIDYVLQEKPIESFNEYLFALGSHTCYWESEDTVLLMLKEIYASYGIHPSSQCPEPPSKPPPVLYQQQPLSPPSGPPRPGSLGASWPSHPLPTLPPQQPSFPSNPYSGFTSSAGPTLPAQAPFLPKPPMGLTNTNLPQSQLGMDPTTPPAGSTPSGPPPLTGFVKQSVVRK